MSNEITGAAEKYANEAEGKHGRHWECCFSSSDCEDHFLAGAEFGATHNQERLLAKAGQRLDDAAESFAEQYCKDLGYDECSGHEEFDAVKHGVKCGVLLSAARIEQLEKALKAISKVQCGLDLNDSTEYQNKYWSDIAQEYRRIATKALGGSIE